MPRLISLKSYLNKQLADPEFAEEYQRSLGRLRFAFSLAALREARGYTQAELAQRSGIKQPVIARYEAGTLPNTPNLQKLAQALDAVVIIDGEGGRIEASGESEKAA